MYLNNKPHYECYCNVCGRGYNLYIGPGGPPCGCVEKPKEEPKIQDKTYFSRGSLGPLDDVLFADNLNGHDFTDFDDEGTFEDWC